MRSLGIALATTLLTASLGGATAATCYRVAIVEHPPSFVSRAAERLPTVSRAEDAWGGVPPAIAIAAIAQQDPGFWRHGGVDVDRVTAAAWADWTAGAPVAGGSTLTEQAVKQLGPDQGRTVGARFDRAVGAVALEQHVEKTGILALYAAVAPGPAGTLGLDDASWYWFRAGPADVSLAEAAFLAASLDGPDALDPYAAADEGDRARREIDAEIATAAALRAIVAAGPQALAGPAPVDTDPAARARWEQRTADATRAVALARGLLADGFTLGFAPATHAHDVGGQGRT